MSIATIASSSTTRMRAAAPSISVALSKSNFELPARPVVDLDLAAELARERVHELEPERRGVAHVEVLREADAVVGDRERQAFGACGPKPYVYRAAAAVGEGVLERVRDQLVDDEAARYGRVDAEQNVLGLDVETH